MPKLVFSLLAASSVSAFAEVNAQEQVDQIEARLDSMPDYAGSTVVGKDDKPLSISGDAAIRLKNYHYDDVGSLQEEDKARTNAEGFLNLWLSATPNSNVNLWTTLTFPFDFSGYYTNDAATSPNNAPYNQPERVPLAHSTDYYGVTLTEYMMAGIDVRGGRFGGMFKIGGVIWANTSPLTMWERETNPRFPSQYELFEEEKTVSSYYKEKTFRPVKEGGRAFWTNRSFGGMMFDIYSLPGDFTAQLILSQPADIDLGTRDGLRVLGSQLGELEMNGDVDLRGDVYSARIAKQKVYRDLTVGLNYMDVRFDRDVVYEPEFLSDFQATKIDPFLINNKVLSLDLRGDAFPDLFTMVDVAVSMDDSTKFKPVTAVGNASGGYEQDEYSSKTSDPSVGIYTKFQSKHWEPITLEAVYLPKDFYSPYGVTEPSRFRSWRKDEFYLGAGTFRYSSNLVGANLKFEPVLNRGRFDLQYGLHRQLEKGSDVVLFNYRLNGRAMWETTNSWTKFKPLLYLDSGTAAASLYIPRVGNQSFGRKFYRQRGGLYGGTWETWESFVPYENQEQVADSVVPEHIKWSSVVTVDAGYDISNWFNTDRNIMLSAYATLSGVSTSIAPVSYSEKQDGMMLWNFYVQSEPAIAITPKFHALLILGYETWRAEQAYVVIRDKTLMTADMPAADIVGASPVRYEKAPINYAETAIGCGFDWDFAPRAGLHVRYKRATHTDENISENDWKAHFIQAETKLWF